MSPMISVVNSSENELSKISSQVKKEKKKLLKIRKYIEKNFEFVGDKFTKEVREIYYDKKRKKTIYGTTTAKDREELANEGIEILSVPWIKKEN